MSLEKLRRFCRRERLSCAAKRDAAQRRQLRPTRLIEKPVLDADPAWALGTRSPRTFMLRGPGFSKDLGEKISSDVDVFGAFWARLGWQLQHGTVSLKGSSLHRASGCMGTEIRGRASWSRAPNGPLRWRCFGSLTNRLNVPVVRWRSVSSRAILTS